MFAVLHVTKAYFVFQSQSLTNALNISNLAFVALFAAMIVYKSYLVFQPQSHEEISNLLFSALFAALKFYLSIARISATVAEYQ